MSTSTIPLCPIIHQFCNNPDCKNGCILDKRDKNEELIMKFRPIGGVGWICPKCNNVMAPSTIVCVYCSPPFEYKVTCNENV